MSIYFQEFFRKKAKKEKVENTSEKEKVDKEKVEKETKVEKTFEKEVKEMLSPQRKIFCIIQ